MAWTNFHDPDPFAYTIWHSSQWKGRNFAHYKNAKVDEAIEAARRAGTQAERKRHYAEFSKLLMADAPYVFLYFPQQVYVTRQGVRGLRPHPDLRRDLSVAQGRALDGQVSPPGLASRSARPSSSVSGSFSTHQNRGASDMSWTRLLTLLLLLVLASAVAGPAAAQTVLRIGLNDDPDALDPTISRAYVGRLVFAAFCDKLFDVTPDLKIVPQLATGYEWAADGRSVVIKLRPGVKFHDGEPFNAEAVRFNIERHLTTPGSFRKSEIGEIKSVDVVNDLTVRLNLSEPLVPADGRAHRPRRHDGLAQGGAGARGQVRHAPGVRGALQVRRARRPGQDRGRALRGLLGQGQRPHRPRRVRADHRLDGAAGEPALGRSADDRARVAHGSRPDPRRRRLKVVGVPELGYQMIPLNLANGPRGKLLGSDVRVRQAIDLAIDRETLVKTVFNDEYIAGNQWVSPSSPYYDAKLPVRKRDVARARQLLKEAGQPNLAFTLVVPPERDRQEASLVLQAMLAEAGITMTIQTQENVTMLQNGRKGDFEAYFTFWSGRPDPDGNIFTFVSCNGAQNDSKYCNAEVDALLLKARHVADPAERKKLYDQATEILLRDMPRIHLWHRRVFTGFNGKVQGFTPYPDGIIRLKGLRLS